MRGEVRWWHDDEDRVHAIARIDHAIGDLYADVEGPARSPEAPASRRQWWTAEVVPALRQWRDLRSRVLSSWAARMAVDWETFEEWIERIQALRSSARAHGIALASPEPADLPRTVPERAAAGLGSEEEAWWTLGRIALYTTLGVLGAISLW